MADINLDATKILLRQVWAFMLMGLYGIGIFQERAVTLQAEAAQAAIPIRVGVDVNEYEVAQNDPH